jgi:FkbM family methyltransferase
MHATVSKAFRSVQVFFPGVQDLRFRVQRSLRAVLKKPHEDDFDILGQVLSTKSDPLLLDIGANRGDAIQSMLMMCPAGKVIAFEPNPLLADKLQSLYGGTEAVTIVNAGLGDETNSFPLHVPFYRNYMFDGLASFKRENATGWLQGRVYGYNDIHLDVKTVTCKVQRLDDFGIKPDFVKIDVQGFEYKVLLGGEGTIRQCRPVILMEAPKQQEKQFLNAMEYKPFIYREGKLLEGSEKYNVFFIPGERAETIIESVNGAAQR